ncbi:thiol-disulfide isomerase and thioredoxin [gamma proteobacterium NOR5-3]|nr:thiol-disulfide isomerase and thioredoxin [gamma proteobacterium NOR5-3]
MFKHYCVMLMLALQVTALTTQAQEWVEGEHYDVISPAIRGTGTGKIEVVEFFWYGCGGCYSFEPLVVQWKKTLADDVAVIGSPAMWNALMEVHAKAYFAAEALGVLDRVHIPLFQAIYLDRKRLQSEGDLADLFAANGVAREDFSKAFNSFGVSSQVRQANARARAAKITSTPEMMVAGKYRISTRKAGGHAGMLKLANFLLEKERGERAAASS